MLLSCVTKYELEISHDEKVEFTLNELIAFIIWLAWAHYKKTPSRLLLNETITQDGVICRIGGHHGNLPISKFPDYAREMLTLVPSLNFPSENSTPELSVTNVRIINGVLGYFDIHGESILPIALKCDEKEQVFYGIRGIEITGSLGFPRYQFKDLTNGRI